MLPGGRKRGLVAEVVVGMQQIERVADAEHGAVVEFCVVCLSCRKVVHVRLRPAWVRWATALAALVYRGSSVLRRGATEHRLSATAPVRENLHPFGRKGVRPAEAALPFVSRGALVCRSWPTPGRIRPTGDRRLGRFLPRGAGRTFEP